eukprot:180445_1
MELKHDADFEGLDTEHTEVNLSNKHDADDILLRFKLKDDKIGFMFRSTLLKNRKHPDCAMLCRFCGIDIGDGLKSKIDEKHYFYDSKSELFILLEEYMNWNEFAVFKHWIRTNQLNIIGLGNCKEELKTLQKVCIFLGMDQLSKALHESAGTHGLVCPHGLNHAWHHDKWRDWLAEKLSIVIPNTSIEPRIESEGKKRADILCRGRLTYDNILGPAFYDVTAGNNLSAGILEKIEKGNIKLWMAGSEQYKRKERAYFDGRANELLGRGYAYKTLTFEIFGGISYEIKNLLDYFIELKEDDTDKIWKELSIYNMKLIAKRVLSKYKTYI